MPRDAAVLICVHGARGAVGTAASHADRLRRYGVEVGVACLKGRPGVAEALRALTGKSIIVAPLLMADGYAAQALLPLALAEADDGRPVFVAPPVGLSPALPELIRKRAVARCRQRNWRPEDTALILVGHGTRRTLKSTEAAHRHAAAVRHAREFADVGTAFLEVPPTLPEALDRLGGRNAVVIGLFADRGIHGEEDLPRLAAPYGDRVAYDGPIGTAPEIADIILAQAASAASAEPATVPLAPHGTRPRQRLLLGGGTAGQFQGNGSRGDDGSLRSRRARLAAP